jgi:hypothetical protein
VNSRPDSSGKVVRGGLGDQDSVPRFLRFGTREQGRKLTLLALIINRVHRLPEHETNKSINENELGTAIAHTLTSKVENLSIDYQRTTQCYAKSNNASLMP